MTFADGQIVELFARLLCDHAEVVSGAYKNRKTERMTEEGGWRNETDEEKLNVAVARMRNRTSMISECVEALAKEQKG